MNLNAGAIQFPLERQIVTELTERVFDIVRRLGQHRLNRLEELNAESRETTFAGEERSPGHRRQCPGHHHRPTHGGCADVAGLRDGIHQHGFECPLSQLAGQKADDEILLGAGGTAKEIAKPLVARA